MKQYFIYIFCTKLINYVFIVEKRRQKLKLFEKNNG